MTVGELSKDLQFVTHDEDVKALKEIIGPDAADSFDSFFVRVGDGEYDEVWGMWGIVPYVDKTATLLMKGGQLVVEN